MTLRDEIIAILKMWSLNGTVEADSAETVAEEIMELVCREIRDAEHYAILEAGERE